MQHRTNKISLLKKIAIIQIFVLVFTLFPAKKSEAALWPFIDPLFKRSLDTMYDIIKGIMLGVAKQTAVSSLTSQVNSLVSKSSSTSGAAFITDWQDYLVKQPQSTAKAYLNDYLSQATSGKSFSGYVSASSLGSSGSYFSTLIDNAKNTIGSDAQSAVDGSMGDPANMFSDGTFKQFSTYASGINNPWAFQLEAQYEYKKKLEEEKKIAETKSTAYFGYTGTEKSGKIVTPGSTVAQTVANVNDLPNKVIAGATNLPEILTAIASQMISKTISQGIGNIRSSVNKEVSRVTSSMNSSVNSAVSTYGPGTLYNQASTSVSNAVNNATTIK